MTAPALLVFDLDGTLIPTMEDYADKAASLMAAAFGTGFAAARADYFRTSGLPFEKQLLQLYPGRDDTASVAQAFEDWKDGYLDAVSLAPDVAALLRGWRDAGLRVAISSNNLDTYVERLARDWPVDMALGYCPATGLGKGEPHFVRLEAAFGITRADMLFVGDSPNDARIAKACGVPFRALLTDAFCSADFEAAVPGVKMLQSLAQVSGEVGVTAR